MAEAKREFPSGGVLGLSLGQVLDGRFEIGTLIGYGGQGVVLNVRHLEWGRNLALKLPLPEVVRNPVHRDRFVQEAETWIRLGAHPNIVRCWFVHQVSGLPGLFLDLISGGSVDDQIKSGKIGPGQWGRILRTLTHVAEGLTHSHSMGVVHRDIKPENLLVSETGEVILTDFGLVKPIEGDSALDARSAELGLPESTGVTGIGQFVGTPRYGAPEQWLKDAEIGPSTDIYALGVLFYELICGRRPFDSPDEKLEPLELIQRHVHTQPPDPREFHQDIPEALVQLCLTCLAKDAKARPQSAEKMIEHLTQLFPEFGAAPHERPKPVPDGARTDLLNNAAVSLHSLGKFEKARELFQRGLVVEAGHTQCLYNLVQLERRQGTIGAEESIRRLEHAKADYELALLYVEEGMGEKARDILASMPSEQKTGTLHRIEGDALMYSGDFNSARDSYRMAKGAMPSDVPTTLRLSLAESGTKLHRHRILFPSAKSVHTSLCKNEEATYQLFSDYRQAVVKISTESLSSFPIDQSTSPNSSPRSESDSLVHSVWNYSDKLVCQEDQHFEVWNLKDLSLLQRTPGTVIAVNEDLTRIVFQRDSGLFLVNQNLIHQQLNSPDGLQSGTTFKACFTPDGVGICFLTPQGNIAHVSEQNLIIPLAWPADIREVENIATFQMTSQGKLLLLYRNGDLSLLDTALRKEIFSLKLSFCPTTLQLDSREQSIILGSEKEMQILNFGGEVIFQSPGPCSLEQSRENVLTWNEGFISLYQISPFRRLRTWSEQLDKPRNLQVDHQGRKFMSVAQNGDLKIWDLDERNRVFERQLLLSPGASYEKLIESFQAYGDLIAQAQRLLQKKQYYLAYRTILNARTESGFYQKQEALDLQWDCCKYLIPDTLENLWERLYSPNIVSSSLSSDHKTLLLAESHLWLIREFGDRGGAVRLRKLSASPILSNRYVTPKSGEPYVVLIHKNGTASLHIASDGTLLKELDFKMGPLKKTISSKDNVLLISERFGLAYFNPVNFKLQSSIELEPVTISAAFPLLDQKVVAILPDQGPAILELKKGRLHPGLPIESHDTRQDLTCAGELREEGVFYWGFGDGTLIITDRKNGEIIFEVQHQAEAVTGFCMNANLNIGVTVTSKGLLNVFELKFGRLIESFKAHTDNITSVKLTDNARYLATRTSGGESRFWEFSWLLTEEPSPPEIEWLPKGNFPTIGKIFRRFKDRFG